jgi:hypothetical protein
VFVVFFRVFAFDPDWLLVFVAAGSRTVRASVADGPPGLRGRSVFLGSLLLVLCALSDGPRRRAGQSAVLARTVRGSRPTVREASADGPPLLAGRSARACVLCFLVRFLPSFLVLPRVLQGIVPRTRG